jgi:hypothetical protein
MFLMISRQIPLLKHTSRRLLEPEKSQRTLRASSSTLFKPYASTAQAEVVADGEYGYSFDLFTLAASRSICAAWVGQIATQASA